MGFSGDLTSLNLADIFQNLSLQHMRGTLRVFDDFSEKTIYFSDGKISLISTGKRKRATLGQLLIGFNRITEAQLAFALEKQRAASPRRRLGEILISESLCSEDDINNILAFQMEEEVYDLFVWKNARFEFEEGEPSPEVAEIVSATAIPINVNNLVMEAARRIDEWERIKEFVSSSKDVIVYNEAYVEPVDQETPAPSPEEQRILDLTDGHRNVDEIVEASFMSRYDVSSILASYVSKGVLRCRTSEEIVNMARDEMGNENYAQVVKFLSRAIEIIPDDLSLQAGLANAHLEIGNKDEAVVIFEKIAPKFAESGEPQRALDIYKLLTEQVPERTKFHYALIDIYTAQGLAEEVLKEYKFLLEHYLLQEEFDEAVQVCTKLVELNPETISYRKKLAQIYIDTDQVSMAVAQLYDVANMFMNASKSKAAKEIYQRILHLDSTHDGSKEKLAEILLEEGREKRHKRKMMITFTTVAVVAVLGIGYFLYNYLAGSALDNAGENEAMLESVMDSYPLTFAASSAREKLADIREKKRKQRAADKELVKTRQVAREKAKSCDFEGAMKLLAKGFDSYEAVYRDTAGVPAMDRKTDSDLILWEAILTEQDIFRDDFEDMKAKCKSKVEDEVTNHERFSQCAKALRDFSKQKWEALQNVDVFCNVEKFNFERSFGELKKEVDELAVYYEKEQGKYDWRMNERYVRPGVDNINEAISEVRRLKIPLGDKNTVAPKLSDLYRDTILPSVMLNIKSYHSSVATLTRLRDSLDSAIREKRWEDAYKNCVKIWKGFPNTKMAQEVKWPLALYISPSDAQVKLNGKALTKNPNDDSFVWYYHYKPGEKFEIEVLNRGYGPKKIVVESGQNWEARVTLKRLWKWKFDVAGNDAVETSIQLVDLNTDDVKAKALMFGSRNGGVYFVNPINGEQISVITASNIRAKADVVSSPEYDEKKDMLYVGTYDGKIYGYKRKTGIKEWEFETLDMIKTPLYLKPVKILNYHKYLFVPGSDGYLYAINTLTKTPRWRYHSGTPINSRPVADDDMIYIGGKRGLVGIDLDKGREMKTWLKDEIIEAEPVILKDGNKHVVIVGTNDGNLYSISPDRRKPVWKFHTENSITMPVLVYDKHIYFGNHGGEIFKLDTSGAKVWSANLGDMAKVTTGLVAGNGEIYAVTNKGAIYALDAATGKIKWRFVLPARVNSALLFFNGMLYIGCDDGRVYAFEV